ncbi:MAG: hypothetical protein GXO23_02180 [Crenarchaeota archaeon]|nr:hypothetical protein [Thermoproteota archaeon]
MKRFVDSCGRVVDEVVIARPDGLVVYSYGSSLTAPQKRSVAALITLIMGSSRKAYMQLRDDELQTVLMEGRKSKLILKSVRVGSGRDLYIGVLVSPDDAADVNVGLVLLMLDELIERLKDLFKVH